MSTKSNRVASVGSHAFRTPEIKNQRLITDYLISQQDKTRALMQPKQGGSHNRKLTDDQVRQVRIDLRTMSIAKVAETYGVSTSTIKGIRDGINYANVKDSK